MFRKRSCAAQEIFLLSDVDFDCAIRLRDKIPKLLWMRMNINQYFTDSRCLTVIQPELEQRDTSDRQQTFRHSIRQRTQTSAITCCQEKSLLHDQPARFKGDREVAPRKVHCDAQFSSWSM